MSLAISALPLLLIIASGYALAKSGIIPRGSWAAIETLSFRGLIPATLILAIARSDLSLERFGGFGIALVGTLAVIAGLVLSLRMMPQARLGNPAFTSLFQSSVRWNAFVALAAAEQFLAGGIAIMAVAIAVLIPLINITCIVVLASFGPSKASVSKILNTLMRNPLVQACVIGLTLNLGGISLPASLADTLDMIGRGALGVGLMAVGAGISLRRMARFDWRVGFGALVRPVLASSIFVGFGVVLGLPSAQVFAGVLVFAAPAASNGYIVAKQMGGDADLYADVMTWQVVLSLMVLPFWAYILL
ncbi:AEC family transporter [Sulfitobacter sp. F26169L]|uniref:AEC family transporter n=1 Tax=Sulfitobacter sp. F26169L TaxID=2996015 RepID=UPI0022609FA0|nr:AEC family transporter [Sulfitobacter sp. F26169L]MCX7565736.1 AEC family transporter [Sulfitobacter sp. F26169L]